MTKYKYGNYQYCCDVFSGEDYLTVIDQLQIQNYIRPAFVPDAKVLGFSSISECLSCPHCQEERKRTGVSLYRNGHLEDKMSEPFEVSYEEFQADMKQQQLEVAHRFHFMESNLVDPGHSLLRQELQHYHDNLYNLCKKDCMFCYRDKCHKESLKRENDDKEIMFNSSCNWNSNNS